MSSSRKTALVAGVWFAITFIASIPALLLYAPVLDNADYILGAGADTRIEFGALLEIITAIAGIATAVLLASHPQARKPKHRSWLCGHPHR